jgi:hypothetical protein
VEGQHGRSCDNGVPLNFASKTRRLELNFASTSYYQAHESSPRPIFHTVSLIFGGSIELAPGLSICLMPLGRLLIHSLFMYIHLPTRTTCVFSNWQTPWPPTTLHRDIAAKDGDDGGSPLLHPAALRRSRRRRRECRALATKDLNRRSDEWAMRGASPLEHIYGTSALIAMACRNADDMFDAPWSMSTCSV